MAQLLLPPEVLQEHGFDEWWEDLTVPLLQHDDGLVIIPPEPVKPRNPVDSALDFRTPSAAEHATDGLHSLMGVITSADMSRLANLEPVSPR